MSGRAQVGGVRYAASCYVRPHHGNGPLGESGVGAGECVDPVVVGSFGKALSSSRKSSRLGPRTILTGPFSAAAATGRARTFLAPLGEERVAPVDRGAQRLLSLGDVAPAAGQHVQGLVEALTGSGR